MSLATEAPTPRSGAGAASPPGATPRWFPRGDWSKMRAIVHVVPAQSVNPERVRAFAAKPGSAAEAGERDKRRRYKPERNPRAALVPFVVEALGRPGPQAMQLLRAMAPQDPTVRGLELTCAWAELSTLIQVRRANLLLASEYTHDVAVQPRGGVAAEG